MEKIVDFYTWCRKCLHLGKDEAEEPCCSCLNWPVNEDSRKPVYFEEDEKKREKNKP